MANVSISAWHGFPSAHLFCHAVVLGRAEAQVQRETEAGGRRASKGTHRSETPLPWNVLPCDLSVSQGHRQQDQSSHTLQAALWILGVAHTHLPLARCLLTYYGFGQRSKAKGLFKNLTFWYRLHVVSIKAEDLCK